jgi:hypothetical protein
MRKLRENSSIQRTIAIQYINSHQQPGIPRLRINSTNKSNQDIQSIRNTFEILSSRDLEILGLNSYQSHPIDFVSHEVNIP